MRKMQKIKDKIIDKMIESKLTSLEVDFLLCISHFQNDKGEVVGVYYKEICSKLDMSIQGFYDVLRSLQNKGLIEIKKGSYYDWDILIVGNDFLAGNYGEGYLGTQHAIFADKEFMDLKANEKLLALKLMRITQSNRGRYNIGVQNFKEKYKDMFGVTERVLVGYLKALKAFFSIGVKDGQYWMQPLKRIFLEEKMNMPTDKSILNKHLGKVICRRTKAVGEQQDNFNDTVGLLEQYKNRFIDVFAALTNAVQKSLEKMNEHIHKKSEWDRGLQPKLINKIMSKEQVYVG